jgi:hypothetical protein
LVKATARRPWRSKINTLGMRVIVPNCCDSVSFF